MINERINISSVKNLVWSELKIYDEKKKYFEDALYQKDLYEDLISLLNTEDIRKIYENNFSISLILPLLYSKEDAENISVNISKFSYLLLKSEADKNSNLEQLNMIIERINRDYATLSNNLGIYKKEYLEKKPSAIKCMQILHKIKYDYIIEDEYVMFINDLLREREFKREYQIIYDEIIKQYNDGIKFLKPIRSYTTIKMVKSDFTLYEIDDVFEKDLKNKLDSCSISIYESLMNLKSDEFADEFVENMISWMNEEEQNYVLKTTLNKFLSLLNDCKNNMLVEGNYEDVEIRRVIIEEYNSYYYRYEKLLNYYNKKNNLDASLEENEELEDLGPEPKNNIFFLMRSTNSYFEHDLEDFNPHYLNTVKELLEGFKYGRLLKRCNEGFTANSSLHIYRKLKDDQVRILFRQLHNNNYLVLGAFEKKSNDGLSNYVRMAGRDCDYNIRTEELYSLRMMESEEVYNNVMEYIENNARKGDR